MKSARVYADAQGESHFADVEIELDDAGSIGRLSKPVPAAAVLFRENEPGYDYPWHVAPRRQLIVFLDGAIEIAASDGAGRTFRGGEILLLEDLTARGHRTRNVEPRQRRSLFITREEETFPGEHAEEP